MSASTSELPALLHHLHVCAGGMMHPFTYGSRIPGLVNEPLIANLGMPHVDESELAEWLHNARRLEAAHRRTLEWLRSSLSGYPLLRAPQLAPETPLTTLETSTQFIWTKQELSSGLALLPAPPRVPELLGTDATTGAALDQAARTVAAQLSQSPVWQTFTHAASALDDQAKGELRQARLQLKQRLSRERLDDHEPTLALPRSQYRVSITEDITAALTGAAMSYADAFDSVHALLTLTACDVFSELALYGTPQQMEVTHVEVPELGRPIVEFEVEGDAENTLRLDLGQLLWLGSTAVRDAVRIEGKTLNFDLMGGASVHLTARVLKGTAQAWPPC